MDSKPKMYQTCQKLYILIYMRNIGFWTDFSSFLYKNSSLYVLKLTQKDDNLKKKQKNNCINIG